MIAWVVRTVVGWLCHRKTYDVVAKISWVKMDSLNRTWVRKIDDDDYEVASPEESINLIRKSNIVRFAGYILNVFDCNRYSLLDYAIKKLLYPRFPYGRVWLLKPDGKNVIKHSANCFWTYDGEGYYWYYVEPQTNEVLDYETCVALGYKILEVEF